MPKLNCWEVKRCGREIGGQNAGQYGVCPAATAKELHNTHGGRLGGRACWVVAGTMCGGVAQGTFAQKYKNCEVCDFYKQIKEEEGMKFELAIVLINRLHPPKSGPGLKSK